MVRRRIARESGERVNPVYVRALNKIRQSGIDHPADFGRAVDLLDHLLDAREVVTYIDEVHKREGTLHGYSGYRKYGNFPRLTDTLHLTPKDGAGERLR